MDKLKDPALLLSSANTVAIFGGLLYMYKWNSALQSDLVQLHGVLKATIEKVEELDKRNTGSAQLIGAIRRIGANLQAHDDEMKHVVETLNLNTDNLHMIAEKQGIPLKKKKKKKKSNHHGTHRRRRRKYESESESDSDSESESDSGSDFEDTKSEPPMRDRKSSRRRSPKNVSDNQMKEDLKRLMANKK